jgi:hypothetical protein
MTDLFTKLNALIRAGLRDIVGDAPLNLDALRRALSAGRLGSDLDKEVAVLRQRVNDAIAYEDQLIARVQEFQAQVESLDAQADDAVQAGHEDTARALIAQMRRTQQRLAMAESDLREHRFVTQDLLQRVNMLEAIVAEAHVPRQPAQADTPAEDQDPSLASVLRGAREQLDRDVQTAPATGTAAPISADSKSVEDDFERRRQRLTKPSA